jgi:hypothetical protein
MNNYNFYNLIKDELLDVIDYHTSNKTMFIKEVHITEEGTKFIYEEISMEGFKTHEVFLPKSLN